MRRCLRIFFAILGFTTLFLARSEAQRLVPTADPKYPKIKYADSLVSVNDRCAVARNKLNVKVRPVYVNKQPVGFCCPHCPGIFVQEPEKYLKDFKVQLKDPVKPSQAAVITPVLRAYVNHEVFYFADQAARAKFLKQPERYCGIITDPVSHVRFAPTLKSPHFVWNSRHYYFASDSSRMAFQATPDAFADRKGM